MDNEYVVILVKDTVFRDVRGAGPYRSAIKDPEFVVHEGRA
jgi:hypothetical protein